jgi:hypothetical protein
MTPLSRVSRASPRPPLRAAAEGLGDRMALALIVGAWVAMCAIANPIGDFPLNDDWAYGWSVRMLLETGEFRLSDWAATNLVPQVLWGALFSLPFGFSFTALRVSTLTLGLVGVLLTYATLREVRAAPALALAGALTVAVNPIYFSLASTFMSDVPSYTLATAAAYLLIRALRRDSVGSLGLGVALCVLLVLNRQSGIIVVPTFAAAYLIRHGLQRRSLVAASLLAAPGAAAYLLFPKWLHTTGRTPYMYDFQTTVMLGSLAGPAPELMATYTRNLFDMSVYLGLFLLPFLILTASAPPPGRAAGRPAQVVLLLLVATAALLAAKYRPLPSVGNILDFGGVGPSPISTYRGTELDLREPIRRFWQVATACGVVGVAMLFHRLVRATRGVLALPDQRDRALCAFGLGVTGLYLLPIAALPENYWFDRYLIAVLPPLMMVIALGASIQGAPRPPRAAALALAATLVILGIGSAMSTHDYLAWNRLRWDAFASLLREPGVRPEAVYGGFEINGWLFGHRLDTCAPSHRRDAHAGDRSWGDFACLQSSGATTYLLGRVRQPGYRVHAEYELRRLLPLGKHSLFVLRRDPAEAGMQEKAREFRESGGEIYVPEIPNS